jgi:molybdopterin molybdotransferase
MAGGTLVEPRWDDARAVLAAAVRPLAPIRTQLADCDGLVLAEDLVARTDLPSFDTSSMDGWAVAGTGPWRIVGEALAGRPSPPELRPGQAAAIATGGMVPPGAVAVIRSEEGLVEEGSEGAVLVAPPPPGPTHVRPAGEECRAGETLAPSGSSVTPALIGLAAAAGHDDLAVVPGPRVALVLFGDELVGSGVPAKGLVRDSLGPQVPAWVTRLGATVVSVEHCPDTLAEHTEALARAARAADLVLTTGGTAAGPVDHLHTAIAACEGTLVVDTVAVRPGHPMLAATVPAADRGPEGTGHAVAPTIEPTWLVGLPGNPQSAIVTLMSLAAPILDRLAGRSAQLVLPLLTLTEPVPAPAHEDRLVLGTRAGDRFTPGRHLGSAMLRGLAAATGFAVVPPGGAPAGGAVRWLALP